MGDVVVPLGPGAISGEVTLGPAAPTGTPLLLDGERVVIEVIDASAMRAATETASAAFEIEDVPFGPTEIRAAVGDRLFGAVLLDLRQAEVRGGVRIPLGPAAVISGAVTTADGGAAKGIVEAVPLDDPLLRHRWQAWGWTDRQSRLERPLFAATDAGGRFELRVKWPGAYKVRSLRTWHAGNARLSVEVPPTPPAGGAPAVPPRARVVVGAGGCARVTRVAAMPPVRISGAVLGATGSTLNTLSVRVRTADMGEDATSLHRKEGAFAFTVPAGPTCLVARRQSNLDLYGGHPLFCGERSWPKPTRLAGRLDLVLEGGHDLTGLRLPLVPAGAITGEASPEDAMFSSTLAVSAILVSDAGELLIDHEVIQGAHRFRLDDLPPGRYLVEVRTMAPLYRGGAPRILVERRMVDVASGAEVDIGKLTPR